MLATLRTKAKYMYIEQRAEPFRYVTPQICCIKVSLKSIFWYHSKSLKPKENLWSVCMSVSNGSMKLTFLHLNPIFV